MAHEDVGSPIGCAAVPSPPAYAPPAPAYERQALIQEPSYSAPPITTVTAPSYIITAPPSYTESYPAETYKTERTVNTSPQYSLPDYVIYP